MNILRNHLIVIAFFLFLDVARSEPKLSVHYGGDENLDACPSLAQVNNLGKGPDAFLAVKDEPNLKAKRIDKILSSQKLWICEESKDGSWYGVVYSPIEGQDCGVSRALESKKPYMGPCKSGWISKKYVTIVAG